MTIVIQQLAPRIVSNAGCFFLSAVKFSLQKEYCLGLILTKTNFIQQIARRKVIIFNFFQTRFSLKKNICFYLQTFKFKKNILIHQLTIDLNQIQIKSERIFYSSLPADKKYPAENVFFKMGFSIKDYSH